MFNRQLRWIVIIVTIGLIAGIISYKLELYNTCSIRQLGIAGEIKKYDQTKDSQFCDKLNSKISLFNDQCKSDVEELDCG
jgi:hypothetical protein